MVTQMTKKRNTKQHTRLYIEPSDSPKLVISTNLDQNSDEENPYLAQKEGISKQEIENFFNQ